MLLQAYQLWQLWNPHSDKRATLIQRLCNLLHTRLCVHAKFAFTPHYSEAADFRTHYVDEGPRDGQVVVCLHGEPTWGYLFRQPLCAVATMRKQRPKCFNTHAALSDRMTIEST